MKITVGIPAYNEEENIAGIITKLKKYTNDIIVCDDGSDDLTKEIAEGLGATVISHKTNKGYGAAINSLFLKAKELKTEVLVTFDADGQHRIEDIPTVTEPIKNNEAELVIGSRFLDTKSEDMPNYRKVGIKIITKVTNLSIKKDLTDSQSGFRAYGMKALQEIMKAMGVSNFQFTYKNLEEVYEKGKKQQEVLTKKERKAGKQASYIVTRVFKVI